MTTSTDEFRVLLEDSAGPTVTDVSSSTRPTTTLSTPSASPASPIYVLTPLTPKFFSAAVAHSSISTFLSSALLPGIPTHATARIDTDPMTFLELVKRAAEQQYEGDHFLLLSTGVTITHAGGTRTTTVARDSVYKTPTSSAFITKYALCGLWICLTFVRHRLLLISGGEHVPDSDGIEGGGLGGPRHVTSVSDAGKCANKRHNFHCDCSGEIMVGCFLDGFARRNYGAVEQVRYLSAGLMIAIRERILRCVGGG